MKLFFCFYPREGNGCVTYTSIEQSPFKLGQMIKYTRSAWRSIPSVAARNPYGRIIEFYITDGKLKILHTPGPRTFTDSYWLVPLEEQKKL